jgi:hypothetical protein
LAQAVYAPNTSIMMKADKNLNKSVKWYIMHIMRLNKRHLIWLIQY